jgi:cyclohexanone monooxygenase
MARHAVLSVGTLSTPKPPEIDGVKTFAGPTYWSARWPHEGVDFAGLRVGVSCTGSLGIQSIPLIATQAAHTTVFQRTPNFSIPARNRPLTEREVAKRKAHYQEHRAVARVSFGGFLAGLDPAAAGPPWRFPNKSGSPSSTPSRPKAGSVSPTPSAT